MIRIPENTTISGEMRSSGEVRVDGRFDGTGIIDGTLFLTQSCVWLGKVIADTIIVEGTVEGDIIARKKLIVGSQAEIQGNIKSPAVKIAKGAKLNCDINIGKLEPPVALLEHLVTTNSLSSKKDLIKQDNSKSTNNLTQYKNNTKKRA